MTRETVRDLYWFFRPSLVVFLCYLVAATLSLQISGRNQDQADPSLRDLLEVAEDVAELTKPSPELSPREVVSIQAAALANEDQQQGILQCALFASPENFAATGPLDRFARMLRGPRYRTLLSPDALSIGAVTLRGDDARVLVSVLEGERPAAFAWYLSREKDGLLRDCWMTASVLPILPDDQPRVNEI